MEVRTQNGKLRIIGIRLVAKCGKALPELWIIISGTCFYQFLRERLRYEFAIHFVKSYASLTDGTNAQTLTDLRFHDRRLITMSSSPFVVRVIVSRYSSSCALDSPGWKSKHDFYYWMFQLHLRFHYHSFMVNPTCS